MVQYFRPPLLIPGKISDEDRQDVESEQTRPRLIRSLSGSTPRTVLWHAVEHDRPKAGAYRRVSITDFTGTTRHDRRGDTSGILLRRWGGQDNVGDGEKDMSHDVASRECLCALIPVSSVAQLIMAG
jgi:hypothetical protein